MPWCRASIMKRQTQKTIQGSRYATDEAHRIIIGVDGTKPRVWLEVGLGDRASVRCDVLLLLGLDRKIKNSSE